MIAAPVELLAALGAVDPAGADAMRCNAVLVDVRVVQGWLDAYRAQVARRLDELAEAGESFGSEHSHARCSGMSLRDAARHKRRAGAIAAGGFEAALAAGEVTGEHVDRLATISEQLAGPLRAKLFARSGELLAHATAHDPVRFERHVRDVVQRLEIAGGATRVERQRAATRLRMRVNPVTGMYDVHGSLEPLLGARLQRAIDLHVTAMIARGEAAGDPDYLERRVDREQLAALALVELIAAGHGAVRPRVAEIVVLVDAETAMTGTTGVHGVRETDHGAPVDVDTVRELLCDGWITPVLVDTTRNVLDLGRTTRLASPQQRRALRAMYRTCALDGCEAPFHRCEIHHARDWNHGHPTDLANLLPVCSRHHHQIHAQHWQLHLAPDRTLTITDPHGDFVMRTRPDMPRPAPPPRPAPTPELLAS